MDEIKNSYFFKHTQKILSRMTDEEIINVKNIECNKTRIQVLYPYSVHVEIPANFSQKDLTAAEKLKALGNDYFKNCENYKAIECYNQGILICPQNNSEGKKLLALLIANRSATFFDLKIYKKVLFNIQYLLDVGTYPEELMYKIYTRQSKCFEEEKKFPEAVEAYKNLRVHLKKSKLTEKEINTKIQSIDAVLEKLEKKILNDEENKTTTKSKNSTKPPVVEKPEDNEDFIKINEQPHLGRYAVASKNIPIGTIILQDNSFVCCVSSNYVLKNCQFCMQSTNSFIACESCNSAIFCSRKCKTNANPYHKYECPILQFLATSGVSLNCLLALRMITRKPLDYFNSIEESLKEKLIVKNKYDYDDYNAVMHLCNHNDRRAQGQFVHYSCMAIFLLRLLKQTSYFNKSEESSEFLSDVEVLISSYLLQHLLLLEYNAHEVSEVTFTQTDDHRVIQKTETIGGALYVNLALFNHSCEPSIIRYNQGSKMIVKTIKPIKKGEAIYENYGPMYTTDQKPNRQDFLESRYCFICHCNPCVQNWPTLESMNPNIFKVKCANTNCTNVMVMHKDSSNYALNCAKCDAPNSFMNTLKKLMEVDNFTKKGEENFKGKNYVKAAQFFYNALRVCYDNIIPPHPDIVQLQQRLRECTVNLGNHRDEPPFDKDFPVKEY